MASTHKGHCLCGTVTLEGRGEPKIEVCHCSMCLHWHGAPGIAVMFEEGVQVVSGEDAIRGFQSSDWAERVFCTNCGSTLYYRLLDSDSIHGAQAGLFDLPQGLRIHEEIFVDEQPDYYRFDSDAPRITSAEMFERFAEYQAKQNKND